MDQYFEGVTYGDTITLERLLDMTSGISSYSLGMTDTTMPTAEAVALPSPNERGFTLQGTEDDSLTPIDATSWNPAWGWTAGQMTSTLDDLLVYGRALATGEATLEPATQLDRLTAMAPEGGYGWASGCIDGWFGHEFTPNPMS